MKRPSLTRRLFSSRTLHLARAQACRCDHQVLEHYLPPSASLCLSSNSSRYYCQNSSKFRPTASRCSCKLGEHLTRTRRPESSGKNLCDKVSGEIGRVQRHRDVMQHPLAARIQLWLSGRVRKAVTEARLRSAYEAGTAHNGKIPRLGDHRLAVDAHRMPCVREFERSCAAVGFRSNA
jgi:hypothetical protein